MQAGTRLGHFEILEPLGAGGMGEVYLAQDSRLGRKVAIKVLPEEYASDPERLARFEQEARAAAALNHPHIAVVHDIGTEGDIHFMVQEYLQGQSLREQLENGALPLDQALDLATEVAEALAAAHQAGIVHRDLKPDNIYVTEQGHAKVLDFGLAKLMEVSAAAGSGSMSPTMLGTVAGQVMGTVGYMAPEQVNGEAVDHRADLFAFGCVLYEMVTGRRAFAGDNIHETLSRIISKSPQAVHEIRDDLPLKLAWIMDKALAKDTSRRYQTATGFRADLAQLQDDIASGMIVLADDAVASAGKSKRASGGVAWKFAAPAAVGLVAATVLATWLVVGVRPASEDHPSRFRIFLPEGQSFPPGFGTTLAISPDAMNIVYVAIEDGERHLFVRPLDRLQITRLEGTEGASRPFFSPDGQTIGFSDGSNLKTVSVSGGEVFSLCTACTNSSSDGDWSPLGDVIIYEWEDSLWQIPANGGEPVLVKDPDRERKELGYERPQILPGGDAVVFEIYRESMRTGVAVLDLTTLEVRIVAEEGSDPSYSETGHIIFPRDGALLAVPFDVEALRVTGDAVPVFQGFQSGTTAGQFGLSRNGSLAFTPGTSDAAKERLVWVDREGNVEPLSFPPQIYNGPRLSPEGDSVAVEVWDADGSHVFVLNIENGASQLLTVGESVNMFPTWSPDGEWIYFGSNRNGDFDIFRKRADLSTEAEVVLQGEGDQAPGGISDDGAVLVYTSYSGGNGNIGMISLAGGSDPTSLVATEAHETNPQISPDGRFMLFQSDESGTRQVSVMEIETRSRESISASGGRNAIWSRNGTEIFYRSGPGERSVVEVRNDPERSYSAATPLFQLEQFGSDFDVTRDGQRFLGLLPAADSGAEDETPAPHIVVILNWFEELKQRLPTGQ